MKKVVYTLIFSLIGVIFTTSFAQAKIWNKDLITKAVLTNGFMATICPTTLSQETILNPVITEETNDTPVVTNSECTGKNEEVLFGDITLDFKESGTGKEYIVLYNDELLRADSFQYGYYKDWSLGAEAPPNADGKTYHGLKSVMADTLYKTDIAVPDFQEKVVDSGFITIYAKDGTIDHTYFVFKAKVYKVNEVKKKVTDKVLIDYTLPSSSTGETPDSLSPTVLPTVNPTTSIYKNDTYKFEFSYPNFFTQDKSTSETLTSFTGKDNHISVSVENKPFKDFTYMDLSATEYKYDITSQKWVNITNPSKVVTEIKKVTTSLEAYEAGFGDGMCGGSIFFIPSPNYSFVVRLSTTMCAHMNEKTQQFETSDYQVSNNNLLSSFKFTN